MGKDKKASWHNRAKCPYWRGETGKEKREVLCDGLQRGQKLSVYFTSDDKRTAWMEQYCCSYGFGKCGICRAIESEMFEGDRG